jgi:hypothetical protein
MKTILYGHASYLSVDGECIIPDGTTLTLYAAPGALLDKMVADSLANGEQVTNPDIHAVKDDLYFIARQMRVPKEADLGLLNIFPIVLKGGDKTPNFILKHEDLPPYKKPLNASTTPHQTFNVNKATYLKELLETYKDHDIHWAACSFAKEPNLEAIGYGYGYKFKKETPLHQYYSLPPVPEATKKLKRAERFSSISAPSSIQIHLKPNLFRSGNGNSHRKKNPRDVRFSPYHI